MCRSAHLFECTWSCMVLSDSTCSSCLDTLVNQALVLRVNSGLHVHVHKFADFISSQCCFSYSEILNKYVGESEANVR